MGDFLPTSPIYEIVVGLPPPQHRVDARPDLAAVEGQPIVPDLRRHQGRVGGVDLRWEIFCGSKSVQQGQSCMMTKLL